MYNVICTFVLHVLMCIVLLAQATCARAHTRIFICIYVFRLKESDKKTVFSVLKKSERDKKKLLETVLKQLRQLAQTTQQQ